MIGVLQWNRMSRIYVDVFVRGDSLQELAYGRPIGYGGQEASDLSSIYKMETQERWWYNSIWSWSLRIRVGVREEADDVSPDLNLKAWEQGAPMSRGRRWMCLLKQRAYSTFLHLFVLFGSSMNQILPTTLRRAVCFTNSNSKNTFIETPRNNTLSTIQACLSPLKLTYKINQHNYSGNTNSSLLLFLFKSTWSHGYLLSTKA